MINNIKIGCCGWSFFSAKAFFGDNWREKFKTRLQCYSKLFNLVEVNSTFYKLPKEKTALKWINETNETNDKFEFSVKASQIITHKNRFKTELSVEWFKKTLYTAKVLKARIILLQSPPSFKPTDENIDNIKKFFVRIKKDKEIKKLIKNRIIAWEPRGLLLDKKDLLIKILRKYKVEHCVDPLRNEPIYSNKILYFRLHGFGKDMMYNYRFNKKEMNTVIERINKLSAKYKPEWVYVLFNNYYMYDNALEFKDLIKK